MDEKSDGQDWGVRPLEEGNRLWTARLPFDDYRPGCHCPQPGTQTCISETGPFGIPLRDEIELEL